MTRVLAHNTSRQLMFAELCPISAAVEELANSGSEARGAIYTKPAVVGFILDLAGYNSKASLLKQRLLEPAVGTGDFLIPAVERLLQSWVSAGRPDAVATLSNCVTGVEVHRATLDKTRSRLFNTLRRFGVSESQSEQLCSNWLIEGDFLLVPLESGYDYVVGNPPYVRQEMISDILLSEYRQRYPTIYDRADLYVPFMERSLLSLKPQGHLAFICSDRWTKNRYGTLLRQLIAQEFHLRYYVDMVDAEAFQSDVIAYPAITVLARDEPEATRTARCASADAATLASLADELLTRGQSDAYASVKVVDCVAKEGEPWILHSSNAVKLVRRLESSFPLLEETGCKVGIGVATGADSIFIQDYASLDIEPDRKIKLVTTRDIKSGHIKWQGLGVINPFDVNGSLVDLEFYPRLKEYLNNHKLSLNKRHVAKKVPANWYRTIDRIWPELCSRPKLLIPDIKGDARIVYDSGEFYPHHNLYFVTSEQWDLLALQAVLISGIADIFVSTYSTKMRGGFLRFQAQYLRRIRVPSWEMVSPKLRSKLTECGRNQDIDSAREAVAELFDLSDAEVLSLS